MKKNKLPEEIIQRFKKGKKFQEWERSQWKAESNEIFEIEKKTELNGKLGRIDIELDIDDIGQFVIVEIKATDWENIVFSRIRPNVLRHARQLNRYLDAAIEVFHKSYPDADIFKSDAGIVAGMIYASPPSNIKAKELIENLLNDQGISVIWREEYQEF